MASKGPLIDLTITRDGVENEAVWSPTPIPLGTKMRGHLKSDGSVEGAVSLTDNIFVLRLDNRYFEPDNPAHRREPPNNPIVCIVISKEGVKSSRAPYNPIPVGTRLQGRINIDSDIEDAKNDDDTIFVNTVYRGEYKMHAGACAISGGSKRKRKRKTKRRK